ncbi:MAG TPA: SDR family oxidoreductase [Herpetosiphonaceae bacterium]
MQSAEAEYTGSEIAIIGMSGRFPGAGDLGVFWRNLRDGVESLSRLTDAELAAEGVTPAELSQPNYVKVAPVLDNIESFDAAFFGFSPLEAESTDPQQRVFLECAWEAIEDAGYNIDTFDEPLGVFAGSRTNTYVFNIVSNPQLFKSLGVFQVSIGNDLASLATRISYKLNLKGPSYAVHTACSTSLVAVHLARQSLLLDECRMAIAGGVAINVPHRVGYLYEPGGVLSPDGQCRAFDAEAQGTIFGSGAGVVVLKRLEDALEDGDQIYAIIKGTATNNDGAIKASFTAPSVDGQAKVIVDALADAEVEADSIGYVEAHGTGTQLGDPIEIRALTKAFRTQTRRTGFCGIGSVKTNIGHLDAAAGISSLIKTVLALKHRQIPPTLHYNVPNPRIDFAHSPFYVNTKLADWTADDLPRRAGVSSFGFGGTNAHIILEEAPQAQPSTPSARPWQLLTLSAQSETALEQMTANLAAYLREHPNVELADVAYTLQAGRKLFEHRRTLLCASHADAITVLESDGARLSTQRQTSTRRSTVFMFPGQGSQYAGMAHDLYRHEPIFRQHVDQCADLLRPHLPADGIRDLRDVLWSDSALLDQTIYAQPALFVIEYALAQLWISWGVQPQAMIGHSIGEYVAATLAGVLSLQDALMLVAARGRLMQSLPSGSMLSVALPEDELQSLLTSEISLAAVNTAGWSVVSGPEAAIRRLEQRLLDQEIQCRRLHTSHAFHSAMMDPILDEFTGVVRRARLNPPQIPFISNVTGTWITAEEATDPRYWARHLRRTVRFADGIHALIQEHSTRVLLEVGPGTTLNLFARKAPGAELVISSLRHPQDQRSDDECLMTALGQLWQAGVPIAWPQVVAHESRRRVSLPTYPFQRKRYWIAPGAVQGEATIQTATAGKNPNLDEWFYEPTWQAVPLAGQSAAWESQRATWLIFADRQGLADALIERLTRAQQDVLTVRIGERFGRVDQHTYTLNPDSREDYDRLLDDLSQQQRVPAYSLHLWNVDDHEQSADRMTRFEQAQALGFYSLVFFTQALAAARLTTQLRLGVVGSGLQRVIEGDRVVAEKGTLLGACRVIPQEQLTITCQSIDIGSSEADAAARERVAEQLLAELTTAEAESAVAYRNGERWIQSFTQLATHDTQQRETRLRHGGVYLITGGLGHLGLLIAEHLARTVQAKVVLTGRSAFPERAEWDAWLNKDADDPVAERIRAVRAIEALGGEVLICRADVSSREEMRAAIEQARARFGAIDGVFHAAGITDEAHYAAIQQTDRDQCELHLRSKAHGTIILDELLAEQPLDFCVLFSSLASILGGLSYIAYSAANAYLDAFAQEHAHSNRWLSINWDSWHERMDDSSQLVGATLFELAIAPAEGIAALQRVLALESAAQVVVSTSDFQARIDQWIKLEALRGGDSALLAPASTSLSRSELEQRLIAIWQHVLGVTQVSLHDNFFDLGGNSLSGMQLIAEMKRELNVQVTPVTLFAAPSISLLAKEISAEQEQLDSAGATTATARGAQLERGWTEIAIIGMHGRFPGASDLATFWQNIRDGVESITFFSDEELLAAGVDPALLADPSYVKARPVLDGVDGFDAAFFGYTPREAELMDPQHRVFLECAWTALEQSGYSQQEAAPRTAVFAGSSLSTYLLNLYSNRDLIETIDPLQTVIGNAQDSLATSVSYKLNLKGPSLTVQTFCSTSLVAVHLACQSLARGECDLALAGGVSILVPQESGYRYQEGGILSPDGHNRAFDQDAQGTLFGNGVGTVVLKRLDAALADGDTIHAVIRGSAINNDGALKAGYTAPSVEGQANVIAEALATAGVSAESISYVEAHGTGTALGDPIEITALTKAFRADTEQTGYCAIGTVKSNIGHLDRAAGVAALIKTVLALKHQQIPPSLHFTASNPKIDFERSPFYVNTALTEWRANGTPRRAGVSSLGFGGTNAHVIVEEAPAPAEPQPSPPWQLLLLSAKTASALERSADQLAGYLRDHPALSLGNVAYTLQAGRWSFPHRYALVCRDRDDALHALETRDPRRLLTAVQDTRERSVAFLFPGQGSQYASMGRELYDAEPLFRQHVDRCADLLQPHLDLDLRDVLWSDSTQLDQTLYAQPALFTIEYALAQLLLSWGIKPQIMLGHSLGEYVAACLAGVFSLEDGIKLVAKRAQLMQALPAGIMVSVAASPDALAPLLRDGVGIAAINGPERCVVAGAEQPVTALVERLEIAGIACRRLVTERAFHSPMVEPVLAEFEAAVAAIPLHPPRIPFISNVTGDRITPAEATDPAYWARQIRSAVRFADGVHELLQTPDRVLVEVGPGRALSSLIGKHPALTGEHIVLATMRHPHDQQHDRAVIQEAIGRMWLAGMRVDWRAFHAGAPRRRLPLPTYPFEHQRFWIAPQPDSADESRAARTGKTLSPAHWLHTLSWKRVRLPRAHASGASAAPRSWLIFADDDALSNKLMQRLVDMGDQVVAVYPGARFEQPDANRYSLDPHAPQQYQRLQAALRDAGQVPTGIVHLWSATPGTPSLDAAPMIDTHYRGLFSLLALARAFDQVQTTQPLTLRVITSGTQSVHGDEPLSPARAAVLAACRQITRSYPQLDCRLVDIAGDHADPALLADEITRDAPEMLVAYRGGQRWVPALEPAESLEPGDPAGAVSDGGAYLITDGLALPGYRFAEYLAQTASARLVLTDRVTLPPRDEWPAWHAADELSASQQRWLDQALVAQRRLPFDLSVHRAFIDEVESRLAHELPVEARPANLEQDSNLLCSSYIWEYLVAGEIDVRRGSDYTRDELQQRLGIVPKFARLYNFMLAALAEDGIVELAGDTIRFVGAARDAEQLKQELSRTYPASAEGFKVLEHCIRSYPEVLTGRAEPIGVLYPQGNTDMMRAIEANQARFSNIRRCRALIADLVGRIAQETPERTLRVLEVGAGEGNLTWELADGLRFANVEYHVTDIGRSFVLQAQKHAAEAGYDFMRFDTLNIAQDPIMQGFEPHTFDIILAAEVIHATPDIVATLGNLQQLLVPNGALCIIEATRIERWANLVWGLLDGWWHFTDQELRQTSPLLPLEQWERLFDQQGFANITLHPRAEQQSSEDYGLIVGQRSEQISATADKRWLAAAREEQLVSVRDSLKRLESLEALGAQVHVVTAAEHAEHLHAAVSEAKQHFGALYGVIHSVRPKHFTTPETPPRVVGAEIQRHLRELTALEQALDGTPLDRALLVTAGASWIDGTGDLAALATMCAHDAYAQASQSNPRVSWTSVDWLVQPGVPGAAEQIAVRQILSLDTPQIIVSSQAVPRSWNTAGEIAALPESPAAAPRLHPRPQHLGPYVPPQTDVERQLAQCWHDVLGIDQVGVEDDFLALGGDSLQATQLLSRIRQSFSVNLELRAFFSAPTIAGTARAIAELQSQAAQSDEHEILDILRHLKNLSPEEIAAELQRRKHLIQET